VALGPAGANKTGSLTTLVQVAAANLKGNGAALGQSVDQLAKAAGTLAAGRQDLFGTVKNLQAFTQALQDSDAQVRHFEEQLAQVASDLANERADLGTALRTLGSALTSVAGFVKDNAAKIHTDIVGLKDITGILVKQKASLNETLAVAPVALANIVHAYQDNLGVTGTRGNLAALTDPGQLCQLLKAGGLLSAVGNLLGPQTKTIASTCESVISKLPSTAALQLPPGLTPADLNNLLNQLLSGLPTGLIGAGS
jgi:phospholipid/cholesterol/gamma-HCH transport system substrate-binding protein